MIEETKPLKDYDLIELETMRAILQNEANRIKTFLHTIREQDTQHYKKMRNKVIMLEYHASIVHQTAKREVFNLFNYQE